MKFSCDKNLLYSAIMTASRAACAKSAIPALEGLLIEAGNSLKISGYDLKTGICTGIPQDEAEIEEKGDIVLNARLFGEIIRRLPDDTVTISSDERFMTTIECGMSVFNIMGTSATDYPDMPSVESKSTIIIKQNILKEMISQTIFAVSENEARPVHTGSLFETENGVLTIVSVDGYRLALRKEKIESAEVEGLKFVVPGSALSEVEKIAEDSDETMKISLGAKHIMFSIGNTVLVSRRLEGEFLNYRQAIPSENKYILGAERREIISAVDRVSLLISDKLKSPVRCKFEDGMVSMVTTTALGKAYDECRINGDGEGLEIGFNNKYLLDALKSAPADNLNIKLSTGISPCIITSGDENDNFLYMILPVRLKAGE